MALFNNLFGGKKKPIEEKKELRILTRDIKPNEVKAGHLIVAKPFFPNPHFDKSVVLVCHISPTHILGTILNKTTGEPLSKLSSAYPKSSTEVYWGGPAESQRIFTLHRFGDMIKGNVAVEPKTWFNANFAQVASMLDVNKLDPTRVKLFVGGTGWQHDQFQGEFNQDLWEIIEVEGLDYFGDTASLWNAFHPAFSTLPSKPIYPRLKANMSHSMYADVVQTESMDIPQELQPIHTEYTEDLILHYVSDEDVAFKYIDASMYKEFPHLNDNALHKLAISTLTTNISQQVELRGDVNELVMMVAGGEFESSLVLLTPFLDYLHQVMEGNYYVALPTRDLFVICKEGNTAGLEQLKERVQHYFNNNAPGLLSKGIYLKKADNPKIQLAEPAF